MNPKFTNPYHDLDEAELTRLQTWVSSADHNFIFRDLHPGQGSVSTVVNILFNKLATSLKQYGITTPSIQREEFEQFLADFTFSFPRQHPFSRRTTSGAVSEAVKRNVRK